MNWKKIGKWALKIAPYAAMAIPGVGVPLGIAIQAGLGAANAKASGANWKQTLLGAGIGAGTGAIGAKIPGLGPTSSGAAKFLGGVANKGVGKSWQGALGNVAGQVGSNVAMGAAAGQPESGYEKYNRNANQYNDQVGGGSDYGAGVGNVSKWTGRVKANMAQGQEQYGSGQETGFSGSVMPEGGFSYEQNPMNQYNQNMPNLSMALFQGREDAKRRYAMMPPFQSADAGV